MVIGQRKRAKQRDGGEPNSSTTRGNKASGGRGSRRDPTRVQSAEGAEAFKVTPFARLARAHACSAAGDALFTISLADSLFFSIDPNDARWQLALYLLLTVAPFAFVAPWLGPAMDSLKGGHRYMLVGSQAVRTVLAVAVAKYIGSFGLFPLAFSMLVMGKAHHVAKSALVPGIVKTDEGLVKANSRLSIISALSAAAAGLPGLILLRLGGPEWVMGLAAIIFFAGAMLGLRIPATRVAAEAPDLEEKAELRGAGIILAASAMGYVRGVAGFLTMLLAFELRGGIDPGPSGVGVETGHRIRETLGLIRLDLATGGAPKWHFGMVLAMLGIGGLAGAAASPRLRSMVREERILAGALGGVAIFGLLAALAGGVVGAMLAAFMISVAGQTGKQSFDAIVQRDAPKANLGRSFSRFESRFQLVWVFGALIPVVVRLPARVGFVLVSVASAFAAISYWLGRDPAPRSAMPQGGRARLASMKSKVRTAKPSSDSSKAEHGTVPEPAIAATLGLSPESNRSVFDDPIEGDDDFLSSFDFGSSEPKVYGSENSEGFEPTTEYVLPPTELGLEPPVEGQRETNSEIDWSRPSAPPLAKPDEADRTPPPE